MNRGVVELQQNVWEKLVCQHHEDALVLEEIEVGKGTEKVLAVDMR